jgi:hypothetical protein
MCFFSSGFPVRDDLDGVTFLSEFFSTTEDSLKKKWRILNRQLVGGLEHLFFPIVGRMIQSDFHSIIFFTFFGG